MAVFFFLWPWAFHSRASGQEPGPSGDFSSFRAAYFAFAKWRKTLWLYGNTPGREKLPTIGEPAFG